MSGAAKLIRRSKRQVFDFIKERIIKKISNWKTKFLSDVGKDVMLKSMVQTLPVYKMSCFKLPKGVCKDITKITAKFWWSKGKKKIKCIG